MGYIHIHKSSAILLQGNPIELKLPLADVISFYSCQQIPHSFERQWLVFFMQWLSLVVNLTGSGLSSETRVSVSLQVSTGSLTEGESITPE